MASARVEQDDVLRSLLYAFPDVFKGSDEAYKPLRLTVGPDGLGLLGLHKSTALIGELRIEAESFESLPDNETSIGVLNRELRAPLKSATSTVYSNTDLQLDLEFGETGVLVRLLIGDDRSIRRAVRATSPGIRNVANLPSFEDAASITNVDPLLLSEAETAFEGATDVDAVEIELSEEGIAFSSHPNSTTAGFTDSRTRPEGEGATLVLPTFLREVARFSSPSRGIRVDGLDLALIDQGLLRVVYGLPVGTMTYWVAPTGETAP